MNNVEHHYLVFFKRTGKDKQFQRIVKGRDCLTALESFQMEFNDGEIAEVQAIRRTGLFDNRQGA